MNRFSHIYYLYYFDLVKLPVLLQSKKFSTNNIKGIFATRTPFRLNPIGFSILEFLEIKANYFLVINVDFLDNTPLINIKQSVSQFDSIQKTKIGWLKGQIKIRTC
ncbi:MAG: TrmO family methyltransferase [Promethearchaeota archaeon]